jgi:hypothetical protein
MLDYTKHSKVEQQAKLASKSMGRTMAYTYGTAVETYLAFEDWCCWSLLFMLR